MKKLLFINDTVANKITYFHILLFFACLPLDRFFSEIVFISFTIHTLIHLKKDDLKRLYNFRLLLIQSVFFVTLWSTIYTSNPHKAFEEWSEQLPILLLPALFALHQQLIAKYKTQLLNGFSWSCVLVVTFLFGIVAYTIKYYHQPISSILSLSFINHNFTAPVNIHATFFSLLAVMALVNLIQNILSEKARKTKAITFGGIMILLAGLIQLSSKTAVGSLVIIAFVFLPIYLFKGRTRLVIMGSALLLTLIGSMFAYRTESLKRRLFTDLETDVDLNNIIVVTDSRVDRWHAAMQVVEAKPIFGYGAGTELEVIQQAYFSNKLYHSYLHHLNAHNQFLSFLVKSGGLGLMVYLLVLGYGLTVSYRDKDLLLATFIVLMLAASVSENVLDANKGIFFYGTFFSVLLLTIKTGAVKSKKANKMQREATLSPFSTC